MEIWQKKGGGQSLHKSNTFSNENVKKQKKKKKEGVLVGFLHLPSSLFSFVFS